MMLEVCFDHAWVIRCYEIKANVVNTGQKFMVMTDGECASISLFYSIENVSLSCKHVYKSVSLKQNKR